MEGLGDPRRIEEKVNKVVKACSFAIRRWVSLTLVLSAACAAQAAEKPNGAHTLTVGEGFVNPVGFHDPTPYFSWKLPVGVLKQTAYRLEVSDHAGIWDSGWKRKNGKIIMDVVFPPNTSATIEFPNGQKSVTVDSGNHHFELKL